MQVKRTDTHRPSVLDPAEYTLVGQFDMHWEEGFCELDDAYSDWDEFSHYKGLERDGAFCICCGQKLRYGYFFAHGPSHKLVITGLGCAYRLAFTSKTEAQAHADAKSRLAQIKLEAWLAASEDNRRAYEFLANKEQEGTRSEFFSDLLKKVRKHGDLSEKQVAAVLRSADQEAGWAAKRALEIADAPEITEGRQIIEGEIVSAKNDESPYGVTHKMLVQADDGNKFWGTIPGFLVDQTNPDEYKVMPRNSNGEWLLTGEHADAIKGLRVRFTAQVSPSKKDAHFGSYKRPTGLKVIKEES